MNIFRKLALVAAVSTLSLCAFSGDGKDEAKPVVETKPAVTETAPAATTTTTTTTTTTEVVEEHEGGAFKNFWVHTVGGSIGHGLMKMKRGFD